MEPAFSNGVFTGKEQKTVFIYYPEIVYALSLTAEKYKKEGLKFPVLLKYFSDNFKTSEIAGGESMLSELNSEHAVPEKFKKYITEMYNYVSASN